MPVDPQTGKEISPLEQALKQYGAVGLIPALALGKVRIPNEVFNNPQQQQKLAPVVSGVSDVLGGLFGQNAGPFGADLARSALGLNPAVTPPPVPAEIPQTVPAPPPQRSESQGHSFTTQSAPLPQAPHLQSSNIDIAAAFAPALASLQTPEKIKGTSKIGGLAQILGSAAEGSLRAIGSTGRAGEAFAGAGGGAARGLAELRREEQALEIEHQRAVQRVNLVRSGIQSQQAGAEINAARDMANVANSQAQLQFNRDVQAALLSRSQIQPLGNGMVSIRTYNPETGKTDVSVVDADPAMRALDRALTMSQIEKNLSFGENKSKKILIDGKEFNLSSLAGAANEELQTPAEKEAFHLAVKAISIPKIVSAYSSQYEEHLKSSDATLAEQSLFDNEPMHMIFNFIYQDMLTDPGKRAEMYNLVSGVSGAEPAANR